LSFRKESRLTNLPFNNPILNERFKYEECFRIVTYDFLIRTNSEMILREFQKLYSYFISSSPTKPKNIYTVFINNGNKRPKPIHTIFSKKDIAFKTMNISEIIPLLEWLVINDAGISLSNFLQIHAGAVEKNKKGFLFPSGPGKGKTTLILGLILDGFKYLTDEVSLVSPDNLMIEPFPRSLCIKESSFQLFQNLKSDFNLKDYFLRYDNQKAWYINPLHLHKECLGNQTKVNYIVFINFDPKEKSRLEEISKSKTILEMTKQSFNLSSFNNKGMDMLVSIVSNAKCYTLFSNNLKNSIKLINSLLNHD